MYIENHGVPRSIRWDLAKLLIGVQVKTFCNKNNIQIIEAPVNDHRAIGLLGRLNQSIKNSLACIKEEKSASNTFHVRHSLKKSFINCESANRKQQRSRHSKLILVANLIPRLA